MISSLGGLAYANKETLSSRDLDRSRMLRRVLKRQLGHLRYIQSLFSCLLLCYLPDRAVIILLRIRQQNKINHSELELSLSVYWGGGRTHLL